ncbi:MAG: family 10 glycosylhydrolase [Armatimonadetes bacterium]|jgi:uncharacterized lipoprotein YddW (UPF0748 family)|nr:family 10 glycosylhydrolase [Armatimonadota bacterium]
MIRLLLATIVLLCTSVPSFSGINPGKIGAYVKLNKEVQSPAKLRAAMKRIKASGIEFIIPSTKLTSGAVNWDSRVAPKSQIADPAYIEKIIKYAHAEGLKVYPMFCLCTEGGEGKLSELLECNPSWAWYTEGKRKGYIDPGNAAARQYQCSLIAELVGNYDVDGLSLDYLRCPNRIGYTDTGRAAILKKHGVDLESVVKSSEEVLDTEGGVVSKAQPSNARNHDIWPAWKQWRYNEINTFMREIRATVNKTKPGLPVASYVWGYSTYTGNSEVCQDWKTWIKSGWLDWINPSGYRYDDQVFRDVALQNRANIPKGFPFYITIGVHTSHGTLNSAEEVRRQMTIAHECGADGLVFFTWEALDKFADELAPDIKSFGK